MVTQVGYMLVMEYVAVVTHLLKEVEEITRPQCKRHVVRYKGDAGGPPHSLPIKLHGLGGALLNTSTRRTSRRARSVRGGDGLCQCVRDAVGD